jgi:peptide/nickel transport system substrate-binding protein
MIGTTYGRAVVAALLAGFGVLSNTASAQAVKDTLNFVLGAPVLTLDPGVPAGTQAQTVRLQVMEPLVSRDAESGEIKPLLATSWQVSDDNKTWTFKLRQGVMFHDGTPFTAAAVKASLERILDPLAGLARRSDLRTITSVTVVDDYTVQIASEAPFGPMLATLAMDSTSALSPASLGKDKNVGWNPVGTGPYKYQTHVAEQSVTLIRNEDYWGAKPRFKGIKFTSVPEAATRLTMLEAGEADIIVDVPGFEVQRLETSPNIKLINRPNTRLGHIGINLGKKPFEDVRVRQALNYGVDRQAIVSGVLRGVGQPADSVLSPATAGYKSQSIYRYDPEKAKALLAEAGYPSGFKTVIWTPQGRYYMDRETAIAVQAQLKAIGVDAELQVIDWSGYLKALRESAETNKSELYLLGWETGTGDFQIVLDTVFDSANFPPRGWNTMFYKNPEVDSLLAVARREVDQAKRFQIADRIQAEIMKNAPWVPLYSYVQVTAYNSKLDGIKYLPTDVYLLKDVVYKSN